MNYDQPPTVDRLSDLPWNILDIILGKLPIKTVVSTSVLSRRWRYVWIDVSILSLVLEFRKQMYYHDDSYRISKIVYQVLLSHRGPQIDKFLFQTDESCYEGADHFNSWILLLRKKGIKDLTFKFIESISEYEMPSCLFSCQTLNHLYLSYCKVILPQNFERFSNLVSLELVDFRVCDDESLEGLICGCPLLERLVLLRFDIDEVGCLKVDAPRLKYLYVEGRFSDIYTAKCSLLEDVSFKMTDNASLEWAQEVSVQGLMAHNLVGPLWCLSHIRKLALSGHFLKFLAERYILEEISFECMMVLELSEVHFNQLDEISLVFSFLTIFSNLHELYFSASGPFTEEVHELAKAQHQKKCCFNNLRAVKVEIDCLHCFGYSGEIEEKSKLQRSDLGLMELLLSRSPVLERMYVITNQPRHCELWFMSKLLSFQRASGGVLVFNYFSRFDWNLASALCSD